ANVIIAEINETSGNRSEQNLAKEHDPKRVCFIHTDVGDEKSVQALYDEAVRHYSKVDVVINNATLATLGMVKDLPIEQWDQSYRVNLRGPVLMAQKFLPDMISREHGIFVCVSSKGTAYLGGYETFKAAQLHLSDTLDAELEGTGVIAFTIGPGLIPTDTAINAVNQLAPLMGMTVKEFYKLNQAVVLTPEEAGAGFAASIVFAEKFKGTEISSIQALKAANINFGSVETGQTWAAFNPHQRERAAALCEKVRFTLKEQSDGWKHRSLFERQWVIRDFKKTSGMSAEEWLFALDQLSIKLNEGGSIVLPPLEMLSGYYDHLGELAKGYEKDRTKLEENLKHVYSWRDEVLELGKILKQ
ncbi:MAG TPA: SDR family oxidoreductase, partial [Anaerolineales bacterium]|nr:SDR family oxidoreductase [Anaerolineales bacterium]